MPPLASDEHARAFAAAARTRRAPSPAVPEWERIAQEMQLLRRARAVHGTSRSTRPAAALDARVEGFLDKRRWMLARSAAAAHR